MPESAVFICCMSQLGSKHDGARISILLPKGLVLLSSREDTIRSGLNLDMAPRLGVRFTGKKVTEGTGGWVGGLGVLYPFQPGGWIYPTS